MVLFQSLEFLIADGWLSYRTHRFVRIDIWQVGLTYYALCGVIGGWIVYDMYRQGAYSYSEVPLGIVNAWSNGLGTEVADANFSYCSSPSHDYVYSDSFRYQVPACLALSENELVTKGVNMLSFTTSVIETEEWRWRCGGSSHDERHAACEQHGGLVTSNHGGVIGQCHCVSSTTYYARGVENLVIAIDHAFYASLRPAGGSSLLSNTAELNGVSNVAACANMPPSPPGSDAEPCAVHPLDTRYTFPDGRTRRFTAGETVLIPLYDLISLSTGSRDLDSANHQANADCRAQPSCRERLPAGEDWADAAARDAAMQYPRYRTTGMRLTVDLLYTNRAGYYDSPRPFTPAPMFYSEVDCKINVTHEVVGWAGMGPQTFITSMPLRNATDGVEESTKLTRYRQGVLIQFRPSGLIYGFSFDFFLLVVIEALILTSLARTVTDFICFYMLPEGTSTVLRNKRAERVNKINTFAQMGLQAAILSKSFRSLDVDHKGYLEVKDLVGVFGSVESISKETALQLAQTVLKVGDKHRTSDATADGGEGGSADVRESSGRITFNDFMSLVEGGEALDFDQFVRLVHTTGKVDRLAQSDVQEALEAYDEVATGVEIERRESVAASGTTTLTDAVTSSVSGVVGVVGVASDQVRETTSRVFGGVVGVVDGVVDGVVGGYTSKVTCFACATVFAAPASVHIVACPQCKTTNTVPKRPSSIRSRFSRSRTPQANPAVPVMGGITPPPSGGPAPTLHGVVAAQPRDEGVPKTTSQETSQEI